jgi:hypothetical protein
MSLFGNKFYKHDLLRKYTIVFGSLFDNISIEQRNSSGTRIKTMKVPLSYARKQKFIERINADPSLDKQVAQQLPRISFEMVNIAYDPERMIPKQNRIGSRSLTDADTFLNTFAPAPYDIDFQVHIGTKNMDDGLTIIEQILPFFCQDEPSQ